VNNNSVARHCSSDTKLNEMWSQVYFVLGLILILSPKSFNVIAQKHILTVFYRKF